MSGKGVSFFLKAILVGTTALLLGVLWAGKDARSEKSLEHPFQKIIQTSKGSSAVAIVRKGQIFKAYSESASENTQFYIGSVAKHMTAYLLLATLQNQYPGVSLKQLLGEKCGALWPQSPLLKSLHRDWAFQVSLLDLLTHRSGLSDYLDAYGDGLTVPQALNEPRSAIDLLRSISFEPEKQYVYSNSNYLLIGKLIEELSGHSLEAVFNTFIQLPAGMHATVCPVSGNYFTLKQKAGSKQLAPNLSERVFIDMSNVGGAGSVISTLQDLIRWGHYLFKVAPASLREVMLESYGAASDGEFLNLGLRTLMTQRWGPFIGHDGDIDSFSAFFGYAPQQDTLIIILTNHSADANALKGALLDWLSAER